MNVLEIGNRKWKGFFGREKTQTEYRNLGHTLRGEVERKPARYPGTSPEKKGQPPDQMLHDLQGNQIELEMQNEELRKAQLALEESRQRYADLYDFAPAGYFTFTRVALIKEANLTAATLLGMPHQKLINTRFRRMVTTQDQDRWDQHFLRVLQQKEKQTCDLMLKKQDGSTFCAGLESIRKEVSRGTFEVHTTVTDITERKQVEETLRESTEYLDDLFNYANAPIIVWDPEFRITRFNHAFEKLTGRTSREVIGKSLEILFPPAQVQSSMSLIRMTQPSKHWETLEIGILKFDGTDRTVLWNSAALMAPDGKTPVATIAQGQDITERKQAEEALGESEEKYRLLVENAGEAIFVAQDGRLKFVNQTSLKLTGYTREEMTSRPFIEFIHPDDRELVLARHVKRQEGLEPPPVYSFRIITQSGDMRWVNLNAVQIEWEGKPATLNFMVDITDRKQAEESLRLSDEKISKAFRASPDWMTISTLEEGRYIDVNDAFVELSGFSREEALQKTLLKLDLWVNPHERDRAVEIIKKEGHLKNFECKIRIKSGEVRTMLWSAEPFDLKGRKYVTDTNRDITELRKAKENLEQALENLRRALGGTVEALAITSEARDPYTAGHQRRVASLARAIGREMALSEDKMNGLFMAGAIHDLGKISIPAEILSKPGKLSDIEFSLIKNHPQVGYEVLKDIEFPWPIARIVLEHHERMNGSGYPNGLTGDQLLLESKILIVADVAEAMISHRPYRPALGVDAALEEIEQNKGILYDPEVVEVCLKLFKEKGLKLE